MRLLLGAVYDVPDLIRYIFTGKYALAAIAILIVYLIAVLLNNKVTRAIREFLVIAASVAAVTAYFKRRYSFVWLMLILLAVLFVIRLLSYLLVTIRIRRRNRRIERRALEKAAMRRGSWKDKRGYSGFIGQVSGTGTNTCVSLPVSRIGKLHQSGSRGMIVNLESGEYTGIPGGDFDRQLDEESHNPGQKHFEKLTAGVYLGELCRLMLRAAAEEGLLSAEGARRAKELPVFDAAVVDAWASGEGYELLGDDPEDAAFARELSLALFRRSARCMCVNLIALTELAGGGRDKPMCVLAEGSLVRRSRHYRPELDRLLTHCGSVDRGLRVTLQVGEEITLVGSAAAALLNAR